VKGRFSYMAPEQVTRHRATRCIDVFAAGIVLWEMLTTRSLFRRKNDVSTINAVLHLDVPRPSKVAPHISPALDAVVLKALARDPADRYQDAAEFVDALERLPIEHATNRAVAAYVRDALASELAERRERIREASERGLHAFEQQAAASDVHPKLAEPGADATPIWGDASAQRPQHEGDEAPTPVRTPPAAIIPTDLEHRRLRGLLAALMLLLVGSAVGLLLARSSADAEARTPSSSTDDAPRRGG
jgi:serine/threonine-protein kinase